MFKWIDWFIPQRLQQVADKRWRARFLVGWSIFSLLMTIIAMILRSQYTTNVSLDLRVGIVCAIGFGIVPLLLRSTGKMHLIGWIPALGLSLTVLALAFHSGGLLHHGLPALLTTPIVAALLAGHRFAAVLTLVLILMIGLMGYGHTLGWYTNSAINDEIFFRTFVYCSAMFFVMALVYLYEHVQRQIEQRLATSENRYALAIASTNDGLFDWNISAQELYLSPACSSLLKLDATHPGIDSPFAESLYPPGVYPRVQAALQAHLTQRAPFDIDTRMRDGEGGERWFHIRGGAVWEDDQPIRMVGFIRDISNQKQLELVKEEFISNVGHEFRTPLTSLMGSLRLLEQENLISPEQKQTMLEIANRNTEKLLELVDDLLDLQKMQSGPLPLSQIWVDLPTIAEEAMTQYEPMWQKKKQTITLEIAPTTPPLKLDPDRIRQALGHLLSEAIKHTPKTESITLSIQRANEQPDGSEQVLLSVHDRGPGIPASAQPYVFDRFAHWDVGQQAQGTGLGMAIAKRIAEAHKGSISFVTSPTEGTTFTLAFPIQPSDELNQPE